MLYVMLYMYVCIYLFIHVNLLLQDQTLYRLSRSTYVQYPYSNHLILRALGPCIFLASSHTFLYD